MPRHFLEVVCLYEDPDDRGNDVDHQSREVRFPPLIGQVFSDNTLVNLVLFPPFVRDSSPAEASRNNPLNPQARLLSTCRLSTTRQDRL